MDSGFAAACIDGPGGSQLLAKTFDINEAQRICCLKGPFRDHGDMECCKDGVKNELEKYKTLFSLQGYFQVRARDGPETQRYSRCLRAALTTRLGPGPPGKM